ncbi:ubiquinol-cytochrome C chaperone family protein [Henriciella sp.]|jgi:cytochrome b pre-mRNA-processing protein 3|uniref:ubiquinol-cytochrome C chaperone family protein n=1 Tax=uncultured Henriciella sp. TaxID=1608424 RepID=UPI0025BEE2C1|nr:ubiquinol-cytochrome C chaperone family protein [Henriciella sp.]|tara:strand:+ start:194 stop:727 length:534 start_codon:yes stop_codon:yes gene_type:complete
MKWLRPLFTSRKTRAQASAAERLHVSIRNAARNPALYGGASLPDTLDGRTAALALFSGLVTTRLAATGAEGRQISTRLTNRIFDEIDAGLRETGVGDASIARKVRAIGERFVGLGIAVNEAFIGDTPETSLIALLERNGLATGEGASHVAGALIRAHQQLNAQPDEDLISGHTAWQQ